MLIKLEKVTTLRDIDSIFSYAAYKNQNSRRKLKPKDISRRSVSKDRNCLKAIRWNDTTS